MGCKYERGAIDGLNELGFKHFRRLGRSSLYEAVSPERTSIKILIVTRLYTQSRCWMGINVDSLEKSDYVFLYAEGTSRCFLIDQSYLWRVYARQDAPSPKVENDQWHVNVHFHEQIFDPVDESRRRMRSGDRSIYGISDYKRELNSTFQQQLAAIMKNCELLA